MKTIQRVKKWLAGHDEREELWFAAQGETKTRVGDLLAVLALAQRAEELERREKQRERDRAQFQTLFDKWLADGKPLPKSARRDAPSQFTGGVRESSLDEGVRPLFGPSPSKLSKADTRELMKALNRAPLPKTTRRRRT